MKLEEIGPEFSSGVI
jgi:hypothetical protein